MEDAKVTVVGHLRLSVFVQWVCTQITGQRGLRLILWHHENRSESVSQATASAIAQFKGGDFEKLMKALDGYEHI